MVNDGIRLLDSIFFGIGVFSKLSNNLEHKGGGEASDLDLWRPGMIDNLLTELYYCFVEGYLYYTFTGRL